MRVLLRLFELIVVAGVVTTAAGRASAAGPVVHRYAVVIGSNLARYQGLEDLSFADLDAVNNCAVLEELGVEVSLYTGLAPATPQPAVHGCNNPQKPYKQLIKDGIADLVRRVQNLPSRERSEIFVWFSGHGNGSSLFLENQPLSTLELRDWLLAPTRDIAEVHLILDACGARSFVTGRDGKQTQVVAPDVQESVRAYPRGLDLFTNTHVGALIATTARGKAHEWSRIKAGILSHELRSALRNAADATRDRRVTYQEAAAFVWSANRDVTNDEAKMYGETFLPHQGQDAVLADWSPGRDGIGPFALSVPADREAHFWVTDSRGVRVLETHTGREDRTELATLVFLSPGQEYELSLVGADGKSVTRWAVPALTSGVVDITQLRPAETQTLARGDGVEESLANELFHAPFDTRRYVDYREMMRNQPDRPWFTSKGAPDEEPGDGVRVTGPLAWWLLAGAGAATAFGGVAILESNQAYSNYQSAAGTSDKASWQSQTRFWDWTKTISFVAAGTAAAGGVSLLLLDRPQPPIRTTALRMSFSPLAFEVDAYVHF
jgi:Caspase domain